MRVHLNQDICFVCTSSFFMSKFSCGLIFSRLAFELEDAELKYLDDVNDPFIDDRQDHDIGHLCQVITENSQLLDKVSL